MRRSAACEIAVHAALNLAGARGARLRPDRGPLFTEPDVVVGPPDRPDLVVQVACTRAARASEKKFWRTLGELADVRATWPGCAVAAVVFDGGQKARLGAACDALLDGFVDVASRPGAAEIDALVTATAISGGLPPGFQDSTALRELGGRLLRARPCVEAVSTGRARRPRAMSTALRRGLGHLLPAIDPRTVRAILGSARTGRAEASLPAWLTEAGLADTTLVGVVVTDPSLRRLAADLGDDEVVALWQGAHQASDALVRAGCAVRRHADLPRRLDALVDAWSRWCTPRSLATSLAADFETAHLHGTDASLLPTLLRILKVRAGSPQAWGYTTLDRAAGTRLGTGIGPHLSPFVAGQRPLRPDLLDAFAEVIAGELVQIEPRWVRAHRDAITRAMVVACFEDRIHKAPALDPVADRLASRIGGLRRQPRLPTRVTEVAGSNVGTCLALQHPRATVLWQSAHGTHVNDKTRELAGRVYALRAARQHRSTPVWLVLDGDWGDRQLDHLASAGVAGIASALELAPLVRALA